MNDKKRLRPFSLEYVMLRTLTNMLERINFSIDKTFERMPDFADNPEKATEVVMTLSELHKFRRMLEDAKNQYSKGATDE